MVERITMNKSVNLGYDEKVGDLIGKRWGYDIHRDMISKNYMEIAVYDRKKFRTGTISWDTVEHRIVVWLGLSKVNGAWHVDMVEVDSRYKGKKLANKLYRFLMKTLGITMMAGSSQSVGGRYIWNALAKDREITVYSKKGLYSKFVDFPTAGERELKGNLFSLYDSKAAIFAVAA